MKFTVNKKHFLSALKAADMVLGKVSGNIRKAVLFKTEANYLRITANGHFGSIDFRVPIVAEEDFKAAFDPTTLIAYLSKTSDDAVFEYNKPRLVIRDGKKKCEISSIHAPDLLIDDAKQDEIPFADFISVDRKSFFSSTSLGAKFAAAENSSAGSQYTLLGVKDGCCYSTDKMVVLQCDSDLKDEYSISCLVNGFSDAFEKEDLLIYKDSTAFYLYEAGEPGECVKLIKIYNLAVGFPFESIVELFEPLNNATTLTIDSADLLKSLGLIGTLVGTEDDYITVEKAGEGSLRLSIDNAKVDSTFEDFIPCKGTAYDGMNVIFRNSLLLKIVGLLSDKVGGDVDLTLTADSNFVFLGAEDYRFLLVKITEKNLA